MKLTTNIKKIIYLLIITLITFSLFSCSKNKQEYIENAFALGYQEGIPYLLNANNERYSLKEYDEVINIFGEYLAVKKDGLYGYIDRTGKLVIEPQYTEAFPMKENKAVVRKDNSYFIIDNTGNTLYQFEQGIYSTSSFSENFLVIETITDHNHLFGYLKYDVETNSFSILNDSLSFEYCIDFVNGYGIIGKTINEKMQYTFIQQDGNLLFTDLYFDEARHFYSYYACVGTMKKTTISGRVTDQMCYKFISENGKYLTRNKTVLEYHHATDFVDDYAIVGKYYYSSSQQVYYKKYQVIDSVGNEVLHEPLYYAGAGEENDGSPANFWPTNFLKYGNSHVFAVRTYGAYGSWQIQYHDDLLFYPIKWNFTEKDETWLKDLSEILGVKNNSLSLAKSYSSNPYYMEQLIRSSYYNETKPITCIRVYGSDNFGVVEVNFDEETNQYSISYIIAPIYEQLFY